MIKKTFLFCMCLCAFVINAQQLNESKIDSLLNLIASKDEVMGSISIYSNGKEIYNKSIGFADVKNRLQADEFTKYRIGSVTKTFTATVIMQLIEEGKLTLDTPLKTFFPLIPNADKIDIESLLKHQSGLFNVTEEKDFSTWMLEHQTREQMLARFIKNGTIFEPKTKTMYSNTNFILLSYIAEAIEDDNFSNIIDARIVKPLKLKRTGIGQSIQSKDNEALSYVKRDGNWKLLPETNMSAPMGAGAIVSTPKEINTFYENLFSGTLVSKTSLLKMKGEQGGVGMGMSNFFIMGKDSYGHAGRIDGFESLAIYFPKNKLSIAFTANALNVSVQSVLIPIFELIFGEDTKKENELSYQLASKDLNVYLGVYNSSETPVEVVFSKNENTLIAKTQGQPPFNLTPIGEDFFKYPVLGLTFKFNKTTQTVIIEQGGSNSFELKKVDKK
ncbi:serine hydrolase [Flavobacteriaceae bacterium R38]|nr:serine hydrolase [Flavobacteriaceae bacterium R38]